MSEQIDWSKAPEGYPLWITDPDGIIKPGWHKEIEGKYVDMRGGFWNKSEGGFTVHKRPTTPSWSGEGLPPVGAVCEVDGENVVIVAHHCNGVHAIYAESEVDGLLYYGEPNEFRPIRTPEQIAADERELAVDEMHKLYMEGAKHSGGLYALYDAGFRKP